MKWHILLKQIIYMRTRQDNVQGECNDLLNQSDLNNFRQLIQHINLLRLSLEAPGEPTMSSGSSQATRET